MLKIPPFLSSYIRQLPSFFSPTERKIAKVVEKLNNPNLKVIILSEKRSKFKIVKNCVILACVLSLLKKESPPEKAPIFLKNPFPSPLNPIIHSLKNHLIEGKATDYSFESIQELIEKVSKIVKKCLNSAFYSLITFSSTSEVKEQKKQIEQLTQENNFFKTENRDLKSIIEAQFEDKALFSKKIEENINNLPVLLQQQERKIDMLEEKISFFLNMIQTQEQKIENLLKNQKDNKEISEEIHSKLQALDEKIELYKLEKSLDSLEDQQKKFFDELDKERKLLEQLIQKNNQIASDMQKIEKEINSSFLEKFKNISEQKLNFLMKQT